MTGAHHFALLIASFPCRTFEARPLLSRAWLHCPQSQLSLRTRRVPKLCRHVDPRNLKVHLRAGVGRYVHRLIASKTHGHLVELSPAAPRRHASADDAGCDAEACGELCAEAPRGDDELDAAMLASKLDAVAMEYNQLLTSQLESQREYFQTLIASARVDADRARADADVARQSAEAADARAAIAMGRATAAEAQAKDADRALKLAERKSEDTAQKLVACAKELDTLRQWNADLIAGKREAEAKADAVAAQARAAAMAYDARVRDLEEQVSDLATFLDAQKAIEGAGDKNTVVTIRAPAAEAIQTPRDALRAKLQAAKGERGRK